MSKQPQNNKGTAVLGSLVFMALLYHNYLKPSISFKEA